jgi:thiosulfate/3-mercaptopyruvate sulfurtransferase
MKIIQLCFLTIALLSPAMIPWAAGGCSVGGCGGSGDESWLTSAQTFIDSDVPLVGVSASASAGSDAAYSRSFLAGKEVGSAINLTSHSTVPVQQAVYVTPGSRAELFDAPEMLKSLDAISEDEVVLDVSNDRLAGQAHIIGAVNIAARSFFYDNGTLKNVTELAGMLGKAGITREDSVMVYSDTFGSGEATAVLWALYCLGQEEVKALDGGLDNWIGASLPLETKENVRPEVEYAPSPRTEQLVDYYYVKSGKAQMVDARSFQDFGEARIDNATFIGRDNVLEEGRLKTGLNDTFARLDASLPVVVYSDDIYGASLVWFGLELMGYDARIYSWNDWREHETETV